MTRSLLFLLAALALPASASAQSLFATRGLGVPLEPIDARARALGGIGVGLLGTSVSLVNPAEIAGIGRRGVTAVLQPANHTTTIGADEETTGSARFPLLAILFPINPRLNLALSYGAYLEQSWAVRSEHTVIIDGRPLTTQDVLRSTGGVAQVRLTGAYRITDALSVGLVGGSITGNTDRVATRSFVGDTSGSLRPFTAGARWEYSGLLAGTGVRFDPDPNLRLGASVTWHGDVKADSVEGGAVTRNYDGGLQFAVGGSARMSRDFTFALGAVRSQYPSMTGDTDLSRDTWSFGGGVEYEGLRRGRRTFPFRLGARSQQLPYHGSAEEPASELALAAGMGFRLAGDETAPLAVVDMGIERVDRSGLDSTVLASGIEERVWRWTFSLSLFGR